MENLLTLMLTLMWNLDLKPLCGAFTQNLYVKLLSRTFMTNLFAKPSIILWNLSLEPWNLYLWNLELLRVEPVCGTLGNLVPGFGRLPQTTPKLYRKNPKLFKLLGEKNRNKHNWIQLGSSWRRCERTEDSEDSQSYPLPSAGRNPRSRGKKDEKCCSRQTELHLHHPEHRMRYARYAIDMNIETSKHVVMHHI